MALPDWVENNLRKTKGNPQIFRTETHIGVFSIEIDAKDKIWEILGNIKKQWGMEFEDVHKERIRE